MKAARTETGGCILDDVSPKMAVFQQSLCDLMDFQGTLRHVDKVNEAININGDKATYCCITLGRLQTANACWILLWQHVSRLYYSFCLLHAQTPSLTGPTAPNAH
jgi:hypothetical protein